MQQEQKDCAWQESICAMRKRLGLSQEQFAKRFHIAVSTLRHWEIGLRRPPDHVLYMLAYIDRLESHILKYAMQVKTFVPYILKKQGVCEFMASVHTLDGEGSPFLSSSRLLEQYGEYYLTDCRVEDIPGISDGILYRLELSKDISISMARYLEECTQAVEKGGVFVAQDQKLG